MDTQTFLENLATIAEAPGGVQRLRDLVIDLGLQGSLTERHLTDGSVEELLASVHQQLSKAARNREIQKAPAARQIEDRPHEIPSTWTWEPLGDLVAILDFRRQPVKQEERLARIQDKSADELYPYYGATQQAGVIDGFLFDEELVLLGEDGAPFLTAGKHVAYLAIGKYWVNNHAHVLRGLAVANRYLVLALNRADYSDLVTGTTRLKLTQGKMVHIAIPVPPLAEQERIVARVEELMRLCDELESRQERRHLTTARFRSSAFHELTEAETPDDLRRAWERVNTNWPALTDNPDSITDFRKTMVQLAVEGRLVPQEAGDAPAIGLLEACQQRKTQLLKSGVARARSDLEPVSNDELPYVIPDGWTVARLDQWCDIAGGLAKGRGLAGRFTTMLPYLRVANVKAGYLALDEVKAIEVLLDEVDRYSLQAGDVLLTEGGDWDKLGRSAIWTGEIDPCLHQNHVFRARPLGDGLRPEWVSLYTNSEVGRIYFQSKAKRTTNLASINMTELRSMPLPVPPAAEQLRILARLATFTNGLTELERSLLRRDEAQRSFARGVANAIANEGFSPLAASARVRKPRAGRSRQATNP